MLAFSVAHFRPAPPLAGDEMARSTRSRVDLHAHGDAAELSFCRQSQISRVWSIYIFVPLDADYTAVSVRNKIERLSPVDPVISRGIADLHPSRGCTPHVTRAIEVSHAGCKYEF